MVERFSGEWKTVKLGEIVQIIRGVSYSERDVHRAKLNGDCLILRGGNVLENGHITITDSDNVYVNGSIVSDKQRIRKNDVVIVSSTASMRVIGKSGVIDSDYENVAPGAFLLLIRPLKKPDVFAPYVSWYFMTETYRNNIKRLVAGGVIQNIKMEHINDLIITLPPLEEQHAIADTLSAFDRHISALSALIAKKQAVRQGALEDLMTGRTRLEGFCGSWKTLKLGELGKVRMCRRVFQSQTKPYGQVPFFKIGTFNSEPDAYITRELFNEYRRLYPYPKKGHVLLSAAGTIGRTMLFDGRDAYFQDSNIVWLDADSGKVDGRFLMYFYQTYPWRNLEGTTIKRLYNSLILDTPINLPPMDEQLAISSVLSALDSELSALKAERSKFSAIRQAAISDLLTGKIRLERTAH